jgi:hypothetical protein
LWLSKVWAPHPGFRRGLITPVKIIFIWNWRYAPHTAYTSACRPHWSILLKSLRQMARWSKLIIKLNEKNKCIVYTTFLLHFQFCFSITDIEKVHHDLDQQLR